MRLRHAALNRIALPGALLAVFLVAGCHGAPDATDRSAPAGTAATSTADPLSDVESTVDAVERDLDADANANG